MIFGKLISGHFYISMSQYGQVKKNVTFWGCPEIVFWLHTAKNKNPDTPQTRPSAYEMHEWHSDTSRHPPDIPQTLPRPLQGTRHANNCQQTPSDTARHCQTPPDTDRCCLSMSEGVGWRLLSSVCMSCSLEMSGGVRGMSEGYLGGVWRYLSGIHGNRRRLDVFGGYFGPHSLQYGAKTLLWHIPKRHDFLSPDHTETLKYQNGRI